MSINGLISIVVPCYNEAVNVKTTYQELILPNLAYIGGGFGAGIHNILEAAAFELPVIFGPNYKKFEEAKDLIALGMGKSINSYSELENSIADFKNQTNKVLKSYIESKCGATKKILEKL